MAGEEAGRGGAGELDVGGVGRALMRRRRSIIAPTLLLTAASALFVTFATPRYASEARLLLESRVTYLNRPDGAERDQANQNAFDPEGVQSQVQVVTSNDVAREAIRRLRLIGNPEFDPSASSLNIVGRILALLGLSRDLTERSVEDRVLQAYYDKLSVYPVGKSRVVGVEFSSSDPELAARGANTIAELYLETVAAAKKDLARSAGSWLSGNIEDLRQRVKEAEAKVEEFRSRNGLFNAGRDTTLPQQQLAEAATQLSQAKTQQADAQAKAQLIRDMIRSGRVFEITEVSNNELIRRLIEQRVTLRAQLALEARTLGSAHPRMKELSAQIADVESQIRNAAERTVRGIENDARVAGARVAQLSAALDEQKKRSAEGLENDVQLRALEREARTLREQLESYLAKYREAVARDADNAEPADARIISRAIAPSRPVFPKKIPIVVLTALASLVMFSALAAARELMGEGLARPEPVPDDEPRRSDAAAPVRAENRPPAAAFVSEPPADETAPAAALPPEAAPASAIIRADEEGLMLIERFASTPRLRLALIGADEADAGALVAAVARARAESERTILVALSGAVAPMNYRGAGFLDVARGEASFAEAIHRAHQSPLHVIARGQGDFAEIAADADAAEAILAALGETYDCVVIDCPADLAEEDVALAAGFAREAAIVMRGEAPDENADRMFAALRAAMGRDPWIALLPPDKDAMKSAA